MRARLCCASNRVSQRRKKVKLSPAFFKRARRAGGTRISAGLRCRSGRCHWHTAPEPAGETRAPTTQLTVINKKCEAPKKARKNSEAFFSTGGARNSFPAPALPPLLFTALHAKRPSPRGEGRSSLSKKERLHQNATARCTLPFGQCVHFNFAVQGTGKSKCNGSRWGFVR